MRGPAAASWFAKRSGSCCGAAEANAGAGVDAGAGVGRAAELELTLDSTDATPGPVIEVGGGIAAQPTKSDTAEINRLGATVL